MSVPDLEDRPVNSLFGFDIAPMIELARRKRLGIGLIVIGWFHLIIFGFCESLYLRGDRSAFHFLPLWVLDGAFAFLVVRQRVPLVASLDSTQSIQVAVRIWITFAILCLTSASLNAITGFEVDWFKISWAMLSTFGFATMAWIFHLAFLLPAVQMSLTALLIASHPDHAYAIFGISWFLTLHGFGLLLEGNRWMPWLPFGSGRRVTVVIRRSSPEV